MSGGGPSGGGNDARKQPAPADDPLAGIPREAPAPPPGKKALTDHLPPTKLRIGPISEIHRPRIEVRGPTRAPRPAEPTPPAAAPAEDPFAMHLLADKRPPKTQPPPEQRAQGGGPAESAASLEEEMGSRTPLLDR